MSLLRAAQVSLASDIHKSNSLCNCFEADRWKKEEDLMPVFGDQLHEVTEMSLRTNFLGVYEEKTRKAKDKTKGDKFQKVYDNFLAKRHELQYVFHLTFADNLIQQ